MNKQKQFVSFRQQVDSEICRLRSEQPGISLLEIANMVNARFATNYTPSDISNQLNQIDKLPKETTMAIFCEFKHYEVDFGSISQRTGVPVQRVRKEILRGIVNSIIKVCIIVRKRSISKLSKNFISLKNIQSLAMLILKPSNFRTVKEQYSILWSFITRYNEEGYFKTVSDENYKLIYRELIILAETYKVNDSLEEQSVGFEHTILQQNAHPDPFSLLNDFRKKNRQLTIDLISEDEAQHVETQEQREEREERYPVEQELQRSTLMAVLERPVERGQLEGQRFLEQLVVLYSQMSQLQRRERQGMVGLKDEMAEVALKICAIEYLIGVN